MSALTAAILTKEVGQTILDSLSKEESRWRLFLSRICSKPIGWLLVFFFSPIILVISIYNTFRFIQKETSQIMTFRLLILGTGFMFACFLCWILTTFLGTVAGFLLIKSFFGWFTALSYLLGMFTGVLVATILQVVVFNSTCFLFLQFSKTAIISDVYKQYIFCDKGNALPQ